MKQIKHSKNKTKNIDLNKPLGYVNGRKFIFSNIDEIISDENNTKGDDENVESKR